MTLAIPSLLARSRPPRDRHFPAALACADALAMVRREVGERRRIDQVARIAANRIYALEQLGRPSAALAEVARRELAFGTQPMAAWIDSLALAGLAAQRALGLRPHLAQLKGAMHAFCGDAAELAAGEGKTLALALAACVHALAGRSVHVVHRDDGSTVRGIGRVQRLYQELGIPVQILVATSQPRDRRAAYDAVVCYAAVRELLFDSLEDSAALGFPAPETRCGLVDDLDQVLVDGAAASYRLTQDDGLPGTAGNGAVTTPQQLFRRYAVLGGVTSTLSEAAATELAAVYGMASARIASLYPDFRRDLGVRVLDGPEQLRAALLDRVREHAAVRRPVLVICGNRRTLLQHAQTLTDGGFDAIVIGDPLASSQTLARATAEALSPAGLADTMRVVVRTGAVMLAIEDEATALDLSLEAGARAAGGVAMIAIGLGTDSRADRRLRQIVARQGNPGSVEFLLDSQAPYRHPLPIRSAADRLSALPLPAWLTLPLIMARRQRHEQGVMRARLRLARKTAIPEETSCREVPPSLIPQLPGPPGFRTP